MGRRHHSPPILQRPGSRLRRPLANAALFDHRGWRHDRLELGRAMVRRRSRPQLGLQPRLPSRRPLRSPQIRSKIPLGRGGFAAARRGSIPFHFHFVLDLFQAIRNSVRYWLRRVLSAQRRVNGSVPCSASFVLLHSHCLSLPWRPAPLLPRNRQRHQPGQFDFYVLALSWSPSFCKDTEERGRQSNEQCRSRPYSFVVHGLWPQYERGFPRDCQVPAPRLNREIMTLDARSDAGAAARLSRVGSARHVFGTSRARVFRYWFVRRARR